MPGSPLDLCAYLSYNKLIVKNMHGRQNIYMYDSDRKTTMMVKESFPEPGRSPYHPGQAAPSEAFQMKQGAMADAPGDTDPDPTPESLNLE